MQKRACFTGHRPEKLLRSEEEIISELEKEIDQAIQDGICEFISGMARGVDLWAARIVLEYRKKSENIRLICAVPYNGFHRKWSEGWRGMYENILSNADYVYVCREKFSYSAFMERNKWMVDNSAVVIAVYNGSSGGTKNTIDYAEKTNKFVHIIRG